jgi:hypothetical protein
MDARRGSSSPIREHISTFPALETQLRALGVSLITFLYVDGDPHGEVSEIRYLDAAENSAINAVSLDFQARVRNSIERDALQFLKGRWIDCEARAIHWRLE